MSLNFEIFRKKIQEILEIDPVLLESGDNFFTFGVKGLIPRDSFSIKVKKNKTRLSTEFSIGSFAKNFMDYIIKRPNEVKKNFLLIGQEYQLDYDILIRCGTFFGSFDKMLDFPKEAHDFSVEFSKIVYNESFDNIAFKTSLDILRLVNPLLPNKVFPSTFLEGDFNIQSHKVYERNKKNRDMALEYHGKECKACNFSSLSDLNDDFSDDIIEVHHTKLISQSLESHNPDLEDLIPLCPNCHSIAHKRNPPFSIDEIKAFLKKIK